MPIWDQLRSRTQALSEQLTTKKDQFRSKDFANASMAMCALIAAADGTVDADERRAVIEACHAVGLAPSEFDL